jgi:hypothetical protein
MILNYPMRQFICGEKIPSSYSLTTYRNPFGISIGVTPPTPSHPIQGNALSGDLELEAEAARWLAHQILGMLDDPTRTHSTITIERGKIASEAVPPTM